jgi:alpha-tubulin suppressor-like RCC1 family protein
MVRKPSKVYTFLTLLETNGVFEWGILTNANEPRKLVFLDPNGEPIDFTAENRKYDLLDMSCGGYYCLALVQDGKVTCQIGLRGC